MAHVIPRVKLVDLMLPLCGMVTPAYNTAAEALAVGLSRSRVVIVTMPEDEALVLPLGIEALLTERTSSLPGCNLREWRAGGSLTPEGVITEEAYGLMENTARLVLSTLCRSSLLRLRSDAFSHMLDDRPLSRSTQSSSCLTAKAYIDNFSHLSELETSAACSNLFLDPQDEASERGLLSLFYASEAKGPQAVALSAWQVKDSEGRWQSVILRRNEVAVVLGHTMQHACAGLLQPARHRVVGNPYQHHGSVISSTRDKKQVQQPITGRMQLQFELRPRPNVLLDLRPQLEVAGHTVSSRFSPVSVSCLMEQFESLLSPAKFNTPDQQQGAAAHAAWEELQASLMRNKKRVSAVDDVSPSNLPITRSGHVRRSAEGLVNQQQQRPGSRLKPQADGQAAAGEKENGEMEWEGPVGGARRRSSASHHPGSAAGPSTGVASGLGSLGTASRERRRDTLEPTSSALYIVRGRTCTVVGGCLQDNPADCITVCVRSFTGLERWFYCNTATRCGTIFEMYCSRLGIALGAVKFLVRGERAFGASTPADLKLKDGEELTAVPESSDRLQQARELGTLYAMIFGKAASVAAAGPSSLADML